VMNCSITH